MVYMEEMQSQVGLVLVTFVAHTHIHIALVNFWRVNLLSVLACL
jgi:hypothetical protein